MFSPPAPSLAFAATVIATAAVTAADVVGDVVEENLADISDREEHELKSAEAIVATTRAALADAEAALRHADETLQAHAGMELHGAVRIT